jgi:dipeptidyl aminopeptidase/acylaminoacyl peptidase
MRIPSPAAVLAALALALPAAAQQAPQPPAPIAPNENLVVDGIPPIPASLAAEVRRYTESRGAGLLDWHPARRELLISTRFANTTQVHRVAMPLGARTQLTFFDEPVGETTYEPLGGRYFLFVKDVGGNEFGQIYRYDVADGRVTLLTDGGRSQNGDMVWNRAGDRIAYGSTRRNGQDRDLYVMDPTDPRSDRRILEVQGGGWSVLDWAPDGHRLLLQEYLSVNLVNLWLFDLATGRKTLLTGDAAAGAWGSGGEFTSDGRSIITTTDLGSEFQRLVRMNLLTRATVPLAPGVKWDVESLDLSPDGRTVAFSANEAGLSRLYLLNLENGRVRPVTAGMPRGVIGGLRWRHDSRDLGFSASSARSTSDVYSLNTATGAVTRWTESELGGIPAAELAEPRLIRWPSFDGREITGFYYPAPARFTGKRPVIINIHGGPEGQSRPTFLGRGNYYVNELGVAVIYPNVRGSTGYGKTFVALDNGMKRMDSVHDIGALLDWIARQPELDASRVMVTGGSYGGFMTLAVATTYNDRIRASLDVVGISNFNTFLKNTEAYRRDLRRAEYGDERDPAMAAFFERTAPLNHAGNITRPLFVVAGGNDPRVPRTEAEQMVARVKQNGSPVWYLMARDEGHGFRKKANVDYQFYATVMFIRQYLLGEG